MRRVGVKMRITIQMKLKLTKTLVHALYNFCPEDKYNIHYVLRPHCVLCRLA